ncbi:MAG: 2,3-bisphosphoglycerate-dependent phosphoglycerate mutase [Patescibacteria group bacterium]|nr:2,3-bisphosphoglycerate-dependent phosphoglycerate mutase [Patescibacteria group bacterium]MDE2116821.1 2,3-bisphosphoglycerate-dependent phosphoglycerate mutase [Patescibacteria group bacterium]
MEMGKLILARHHESEWNKLGLWTGRRDRHLTEYGFQKSAEMGELIRDIRIDRAFASMQVRSIETLSSMLEATGRSNIPEEHSAALDERDYGDYTGKDKWAMQKLIGEERWDNLRREWDCPIPNGETLKMVSERVLPYFLETVLPHIRKGENVLVVAHGNSCRALIKYIEKISDEDIKDVEMPFGAVYVYDLDKAGHMTKKQTLSAPSDVNA